MLCDKCQQREAVVNFTEISNNEKKIRNLCFECAQKEGFENPLLDLSKILGKLLINLLEQQMQYKSKSRVKKVGKEIQCEGCHLTWSEFEQYGLLGCPQCYITFDKELRVLLRRIHGNNKHIGQILPGNMTKNGSESLTLETLEKKLHHAIQTENFEKAAELRDKIREIKAG